METQKIGIREFRDNLSSYLLESSAPVAITKHGDTIGYYIPARRNRTDSERKALEEAAETLSKMMLVHGLSEDEIVKNFKQWRKGSRK